MSVNNQNKIEEISSSTLSQTNENKGNGGTSKPSNGKTRIDPLQLLGCLKILLNSKGGIKSINEVHRVAGLMSKYSKKLVSKCIYLNILLATDVDLLDEFFNDSGWNLICSWLLEAVNTKNYPLTEQILSLLFIAPATTERLKRNNLPKIVKDLSQGCCNNGAKSKAENVLHIWKGILKSSDNADQKTDVLLSNELHSMNNIEASSSKENFVISKPSDSPHRGRPRGRGKLMVRGGKPKALITYAKILSHDIESEGVDFEMQKSDETLKIRLKAKNKRIHSGSDESCESESSPKSKAKKPIRKNKRRLAINNRYSDSDSSQTMKKINKVVVKDKSPKAFVTELVRKEPIKRKRGRRAAVKQEKGVDMMNDSFESLPESIPSSKESVDEKQNELINIALKANFSNASPDVASVKLNNDTTDPPKDVKFVLKRKDTTDSHKDVKFVLKLKDTADSAKDVKFVEKLKETADSAKDVKFVEKCKVDEEKPEQLVKMENESLSSDDDKFKKKRRKKFNDNLNADIESIKQILENDDKDLDSKKYEPKIKNEKEITKMKNEKEVTKIKNEKEVTKIKNENEVTKVKNIQREFRDIDEYYKYKKEKEKMEQHNDIEKLDKIKKVEDKSKEIKDNKKLLKDKRESSDKSHKNISCNSEKEKGRKKSTEERDKHRKEKNRKDDSVRKKEKIHSSSKDNKRINQRDSIKNILEKLKPMSTFGMAKIPRKTSSTPKSPSSQPVSFMDALGSADSDSRSVVAKPKTSVIKGSHSSKPHEKSGKDGSKSSISSDSQKKPKTLFLSPVDAAKSKKSVSSSSSPIVDKNELISPKRHSFTDDGGFMAAITAAGGGRTKKISRKRRSSESESNSKENLTKTAKSADTAASKSSEDHVSKESESEVKIERDSSEIDVKDNNCEEKAISEELQAEQKIQEIVDANETESCEVAAVESQTQPIENNVVKEDSETDSKVVNQAIADDEKSIDDGEIEEEKDDFKIAAPVPMPPCEEYEKVQVVFKKVKNLKSSLSLQKANAPSKRVRWKPEEKLINTFYFPMDETERVNVNTVKFHDMLILERAGEREMFCRHKAGFDGERTNSFCEDLLPYKLYPLELPPRAAIPGCKSLEKHIQATRELNTMATFYNPIMLPETPTEPDLEIVPKKDPIMMPINDTTGNSSYVDNRRIPWPEPLCELPTNQRPSRPTAQGIRPPTQPNQAGGGHWVMGNAGAMPQFPMTTDLTIPQMYVDPNLPGFYNHNYPNVAPMGMVPGHMNYMMPPMQAMSRPSMPPMRNAMPPQMCPPPRLNAKRGARGANSSKIPCRHFKAGKCNLGVKCSFKHNKSS